MLTTKALLKLIRNIQTTIPEEHRPSDNVLEFIDMGHGGIINGEYTTAPKKMYQHDDFTFYEGLWTRAVGWLYAMELYVHDLGYKVITPGHKDYSLGFRCEQANNYAKYNPMYKTYYHSIHGNAFGVEDVNGIEVYTSPGETPADPIATVMFNNLKDILRWKMRPGLGGGDPNKPDTNDPDKEARFTVLMKTDMPSVLSETGFYTNLAECIRMLEYVNMQKIVRAFRLTHETVIHKKMLP